MMAIGVMRVLAGGLIEDTARAVYERLPKMKTLYERENVDFYWVRSDGGYRGPWVGVEFGSMSVGLAFRISVGVGEFVWWRL